MLSNVDILKYFSPQISKNSWDNICVLSYEYRILALTYPDPTDVNHSVSIGSLSRLIQEVFDDSVFVIEPETKHGPYYQNILC